MNGCEYNIDSNQKAYPPTQSPEYLFVNKGDQLKLDVKLTINGYPYALKTGESIWFDVKKYTYNTENTPVLIHIEQEGTRIIIPEITLDVGDYTFDIGIIHADGTTKTLLPSLMNRSNKLVVGNRVGTTSGDIRGDIYTDVYAVKLSRDQCSNCDKDYDKKLQFLQKKLDIIEVELSETNETVSKSFIVVDTISDLDNLPCKDLVDGKVAKVNKNEDGVPSYYTWNDNLKKWVETDSSVSDPRAFITVNTAEDLVSLPESELVHGKLARVNRPKVYNSDNSPLSELPIGRLNDIPGIIQDPTGYYKPAYYSYDSIGKKWVLTNFGSSGGSSVTQSDIDSSINKHNASSESHSDIRSTLNSTMISVDKHDDLYNLTKSSVGRLVRVGDDDGKGTTKYYVAIDRGELGIGWEEELFGSADRELADKVSKIEENVTEIESSMSWSFIGGEIENI